ncbi:SGNH/GDSL hydrolase family protein [Herbiconiux sp. SYSU D00978]|uniref:SGNH/GDSL hydrolase family protein n=1 Tax=Herbiconiux sp. SYSU D00978 TaxID=2812562 RepID=UPI001A96D01D|nr:SGNH/GDSL hydrolase family protein [Herbiconiux sp. SYSU D00978]
MVKLLAALSAAFLSIALAGCVVLQTQLMQVSDVTPVEPGEPVTVAFLGDSITSGFGEIDYSQIWPASASAEHGWRMEQFSVPGTGYLAHTPQDDFSSRVAAVAEVEPDVIVVAGGTNDYPFPAEDVRVAASDLLDELQDAAPDADIVMLSAFLPPAFVTGFTPDGRSSAQLVDEQTVELRDLAEDRGIPFIDTRTVFTLEDTSALILPDGVHPTTAGQQLLAEYLGPRIVAAID